MIKLRSLRSSCKVIVPPLFCIFLFISIFCLLIKSQMHQFCVADSRNRGAQRLAGHTRCQPEGFDAQLWCQETFGEVKRWLCSFWTMLWISSKDGEAELIGNTILNAAGWGKKMKGDWCSPAIKSQVSHRTLLVMCLNFLHVELQILSTVIGSLVQFIGPWLHL